MFKWLERYYEYKLTERIRRRFRNVYILDTSVLVDGRIGALLKHDGLAGDVIIPRFVIQHLEVMGASKQPHIAKKSKRGMLVIDSLKRILFETGKQLTLTEYPKLVPNGIYDDETIIRFCKENAVGDPVLVTMDANLTKTARAHGVRVLNLHEILNELQEVVFPGDKYTVTLVSAGKEDGQCIAYLKDNTLVVVNNSIKYLKKSVPIVITNVLKNDNGRIAFAELQWEERV